MYAYLKYLNMISHFNCLLSSYTAYYQEEISSKDLVEISAQKFLIPKFDIKITLFNISSDLKELIHIKFDNALDSSTSH